MKKIELNFIESWAKVRESGRNRYALRTGVLWSVFTAFLTKIFELSFYSFKETYFTTSFLNYLALFILVGIVLFWKFIWNFNEKRYHTLINKKEDESYS